MARPRNERNGLPRPSLLPNAAEPAPCPAGLSRFTPKFPLVLSALVFLLIAACTFAAQIPAGSEEDLIHQGDVVDVDVVGGFDHDWRGRLNPEGFLDGVDAYGEQVYALCRSESDVAADIARFLGKYLRGPVVVVRIVDRSGRALARLEGGVRTPTRFRLVRKANLRELIVASGGLTDDVSGEINIFRPGGSTCTSRFDPKSGVAPTVASQTIRVKIGQLLKGMKSADPEIKAGDLITVERASPVYVTGAVNNPRPVYFREKITLQRAVAMAGGISREASGAKVFIYRRDPTLTKSIEADLLKIRRGQAIDVTLEPYDIVEVAGKGGLRQKYAPSSALAGTRPADAGELPLKVID